MPKAYIIAHRAISYRRYITRSGRNGYHWKKHFFRQYYITSACNKQHLVKFGLRPSEAAAKPLWSIVLRVERIIRTRFKRRIFAHPTLKYSLIHWGLTPFLPCLTKNPLFLKSLTSKGKDFEGFLTNLGEARLAPCKNKLGEKHRKITLWGEFGLFVLPYM